MKIIFTLVLLLSQAQVFAKEEKEVYQDLELFNKILYIIETQYYQEVDRKKLVEGALKGMMDTLDPHSAYLNEKIYKKMREDTDGEFGGLGIEVTQKEGIIYVVTPIEDSPAFKAGILPRDKIVEIDHKKVVGIPLSEAIDRMKGENGKKVHLGVMREGVDEMKNFNIRRERIKLRPVKSAVVNDHYLWVRLTQFQRRSAEYMEKAIETAKKNNQIKGIVLDLRSNPGGLLEEAVNVSSLFLRDGVVVSTEARDPKNKEIHYVRKSGTKDLKTPLVVLINGRSASASEIVAGALQDHKRAIILGTQSFGKGSVQTVAKVDKEAGIKLTIAQYMTPQNRKIQAVGIKPDIEILESEAKWTKENLKEENIIREKDLRNHLSASVDKKENKKKSARKGKKQKTILGYSPSEDYQVLQAVKFLKTLTLASTD